ncbi:MAG: beta-ketoacyl-[acyl-carrier-protein] synthase family protein [Acidobacteria bacterium]|nr:beta-ketoacyl-[acyl-carrier-protein] synthase family protein [Acidobacteriota bacterium]
MRRVAITGLGAICALGAEVQSFWHALLSGVSGIRPIQAVDMAGFRFRSGAEVANYDAAQYWDGGRADQLDRFAQFAVIAAREALRDSGINMTPQLAARTAVVMGSSVGGQSSQDAGFQEVYLRGRPRVHPLTIPRAMANAGSSHISMEFGITGPALTTSTACSSANHAIGLAFWMVRSGVAEIALAGGSEAPFSYGLLRAWEAMRVVSPDVCRPFSRDRAGLVLGEGGAILVLEPAERAAARGARIYGEIAGFGMSADAHHITQPSSAGPAAAMLQALADGGLKPAAVGHINAHGTGTVANDAIESRAIREVFGAESDAPLVNSTKSMHGHALGAAGALEAVAAVLALHTGIIPPTINFRQADPECSINLVANQAQAAAIAACLSNSFAFGGLNAVLAFRRHTS